MTWGAMDKFQAHYVVKRNDISDFEMMAHTVVSTKGHFGAKQVLSVSWSGAGKLAKTLGDDSSLNGMIAKLPVREAHIFVEPTDSGVRIHGKWRGADELQITQQEFEIYDRIAGHIKSC